MKAIHFFTEKTKLKTMWNGQIKNYPPNIYMGRMSDMLIKLQHKFPDRLTYDDDIYTLTFIPHMKEIVL